MLEDIVGECYKVFEILQIPPAERHAPPPAASDALATGVVLPDKVDDGATSENHAGSGPRHTFRTGAAILNYI